ncbi:MAG: M23 family metallopeptidase [Bacteroidales bacterium]|jgi:murein DD-endopeptidase MepM/ murein hydrolase activator NlpD|nr:M23 family metallopeptidase [Bacteroidales bacterium]
MAKGTKYVFDPHSLSVKKVTVSKKEVFNKILFYLSFTIVLFASAVAFTVYVFDSPKERKLRRDLEQSRFQYRQLDRRVDLLSHVLKDIQTRDENLYRIIFEAEPPKKDARLLGNETYEEFRVNSSADLIINTSLRVDELTKRMYTQSTSFDDVYKMARSKQEMLAAMPAIFPVNKETAQVHSGFGTRMHPIYRVYQPHTGVDIIGPHGTPIYATGDGTVTRSGDGYGGYGIVVVIDHGFGFQTLYGHLSKRDVQVGQKVKRGDIIGRMGNTGRSVGTHLHYEVILHGKHVNPVHYFFNDVTPEEYLKILEKANETNQSMS